MNKKYLFFVIVLIIIIGIGSIILYNNSKKSVPYNNSTNNTKLATQSNTNYNNSEIQNLQKQNIIEKSENIPNNLTEEEIASYSSPLKSKAAGRLNNIRITCSALNGTVVSKGEIFSFCETLGPSTAEKGYEKADVIINGKTELALGGGNCQVSSTLYNAVLMVPDLEVIERHEHGKNVGYVPEGKDATVSYGSVDFKFKNNSNNDIKLYFSSDDENVNAKIVRLH